MLYASAPTFGQGVIDPVADIAALGQAYDVGAGATDCRSAPLTTCPFSILTNHPTTQSIDER